MGRVALATHFVAPEAAPAEIARALLDRLALRGGSKLDLTVAHAVVLREGQARRGLVILLIGSLEAVVSVNTARQLAAWIRADAAYEVAIGAAEVDALAALIRTEADAAEGYQVARACRGCGCTDEMACPGGCHWVEPDLCSRCAAVEAAA